MSALLTTTMPNMGKTIEAFVDAGAARRRQDHGRRRPGDAGVRRRHGRRRLRQGRDGLRRRSPRIWLGVGARACRSRRPGRRGSSGSTELSELFGSMIETVDRAGDAALPVQEPPRPAARRSSAAATSASRRNRRRARSAAATTSSTTAGLGNRPEPDGRGRRDGPTRTLFDDADDLALRVPTSCRRTGRCRECVVEVTGGAEHLCPPTDVEAFLRDAVPARLPGGGRRRTTRRVEFEVLRRRLRIVVPEPTDAALSTRSRWCASSTASCTWGEEADRADASRRRLRRRGRRRHDDGRVRARRPARQPVDRSRSWRSRTRSASAAATS